MNDNKYFRMNKILEEEGTCELSLKEEESFADSEAHKLINELENQSELDAGWEWEWFK